MEVQMIASAAVALLGPYLRKSAEAFMEHYGKKAAEKVGALVVHMNDGLAGDQYAAKTLARVREKPESEARTTALQEVLAEKMTENPAFAQTLMKLVQEAQAVSGVQTISIGGDVRSSSTIAGSTVSNSTIVSGEDVTVVVAQKYWQGMRPTAAPDELRRATERYLRYIIDRYRYISFKGLGVADRIPLRLPLLGIYVPLRARLLLPGGDLWRPDVHVAGRSLADQGHDGSGGALAEPHPGRLGEPEPVVELLQQYQGLVVLGDPGAGKTTLVKYLALRLAQGEGVDMGLGHRLPVPLSLAAYAAELEQDDVRLDEFVADYYQRRTADLPLSQMLKEALQRGTTLVLLDGLDEVRDLSMRSTVVERVVDFYTYHAQAGNKFVITSRVVGYGAVRASAAGLAECTLVDFDQGEIEAFIDSWTTVLELQAQGDNSFGHVEAARERRSLLTAIRSNPDVTRLAANPLLLTILALMQRQGVSLPQRRVQLYDQYIRTMLSTWNRARSLNQRLSAPELDDVQAMRILAPLALWMHEINPGAGLARREVVRRKLEDLYRERGAADPERAARQFLDDVREHAGLFLERGPDMYGFIHLTFEEYLAAVALAVRGQGDPTPVIEFISERIDNPGWSEVSLLAISYLGLIQQLDSVAGAVIDSLIQRTPGRPGAAVVLAGQAVLDAWPGGIPAGSREQVLRALVPAMQDSRVAFDLRRRAGLTLGHLGWQPTDLDHFVEIPAGEFPAGPDRQPARIARRYWIGQYPVTNAQFARFMDAGGYDRPELWSDSASDILQSGRREPRYWMHGDLSNPLLPVVGLTWYEAQAYCNWLGQMLEHDGIPTAAGRVGFPAGGLVRLPTELEWERAAAGAQGLAYPWGDSFDSAHANTGYDDPESSPPVGPSAVCTYPQGSSPEGVWDLSGNVWEWTSSWDAGTAKRAVRGGSWVSDADSARSASCNSIAPDAALDFLGFRAVIVEVTGP